MTANTKSCSTFSTNNKKHTIEVVVDRLKVSAGIEQRLAESFETAVQMAEGIAIVTKMDGADDKELVFSSLFAAPRKMSVNLPFSLSRRLISLSPNLLQ